MKNLYLIPLLILIFDISLAQTGIRNNGNTIIISDKAVVKVIDGDFTNNTENTFSGKIDNEGLFMVDGDFVNNSFSNVFINLNTAGDVVLNGANIQEIGGSGNSVKFENLYIANQNYIELTGNNNQEITNNLVFLDGIISTGQNTLIVSKTDSSSILGYNDTNFVFGHLRRYITTNTQTYAFPIGNGLTNSDYYLAELKNNNLSGVNYIDAYFGNLTNHNDADMVATEAGMTYNSLSTEGVWYLTPDSSINSGTYDLRCYINNFSGLSDNRFAILSRQDSSLTAADWAADPAGIGNPGINPSNGTGRLVSDGFALRQGFSHFTQFGIGQIQCNVAQLPSDTSLCDGTTITLYPGHFDQYLWSDGSTDSTLIVSTSGDYYVQTTDTSAGCGSSTDTIHISISNISYTVDTQNVSCYGMNDGSLTISPIGGTADYHFQWNNSLPDDSVASNLSPGSYYVTITDANGCTAVVQKIPITEPDSLYITSTITDPLCYNQEQGAIDVSSFGGTPNYTYQWNTGATSESLSDVVAGTYTLSVTDANGCVKTQSFTLVNPNPITVLADTGIDNTTHYGYINVTSTTGGTSPYSYTWSNNETAENISNLESGEYILTVTDINNCSSIDTFEIKIPLLIPDAITPNEDGFNDTWNIINIGAYNDIKIEIYNRWGDMVYQYTGTGKEYAQKTNQWDGKYNGKDLPQADYVYILSIDNDTQVFKGVLLLKR